MSEVIDLDALAPQPAIIKLGGEEITVNPPKFSDYLLLNDIIVRLENVPKTDIPLVDGLEAELRNFFYRVIPQIQDKPLQKPQLETLIGLFMDMITPPQTKELAKQGITPTPSKKAE